MIGLDQNHGKDDWEEDEGKIEEVEEEEEEEALEEESAQELRRSTRTIIPNKRYFNDNTVN